MEEKLSKILHYIGNYQKFCYKDDLLDYYQVFELSKDDSCKNLINKIKQNRLKVLFHPDLENYIPDEYRQDFMILSDSIRDMENVFSDHSSKERYDNELKKNKKNAFKQSRYDESQENYYEGSKKGKSNENNQSDNNEQSFSAVFVSEAEKFQFDESVKFNIKKYGFDFTFDSIKSFVFNKRSAGFTREEGVRRFIEGLGQDKIYSILKEYGDNKEFSLTNLSSIVYYFLSLLNGELRVKMDSFISAVTETIFKYDNVQGERAVLSFLCFGYLDCFTNDNNARINLAFNVKKGDGRMLVVMYLAMYRNFVEKYNFENLFNLSNADLSKEFVSFLSEQLNLDKNSSSKYGR